MPPRFLPHLLSDVATAVIKTSERRLGCSTSEARILMAMEESRDATPTALARAANLSKVDVSRVVARLISARLISSKTCPQDRRVRLLRLTTKGTVALAAVADKSAKVQHELLTVLAPHEVAGLLAALEKLQATAAAGE